MEFGGRYIIAASRQQVWLALNDPNVLKTTIPGCSMIAWSGERTLDLEIKVNLGVMHPTFKGELELSNIDVARSYTLAGRGKGGLLGFVEGSADISLADEGEDTLLEFVANGGGSGQLMKLGRAVIGSSAQKIIDGFFERFGEAIGAVVTPLTPGVEPVG